MIHIIFADDNIKLHWPKTLSDAWDAKLKKKHGEATVELITDRESMLRRLGERQLYPNLLFVDLNWGKSENEGLELIEKARKTSNILPILVLTNMTLDINLFNRCTKAGATAVFNKQLDDLPILLKCVDNQLSVTTPVLQKAAEIRKQPNRDKMVSDALDLFETGLDQIPIEILREALVWFEKWLLSRIPLEQRNRAISEVLNCSVEIVHELERKGVADEKDKSTLAENLFNLGRWKEARQAYLELIKSRNLPENWSRLVCISQREQDEPGQIEAIIGLADSYQQMGKQEPALDVLTNGLKQYPFNDDLKSNWARVCASRSEERKVRALCDILLSWEEHNHLTNDAAVLLHRFSDAQINWDNIIKALSILSNSHSWANKMLGNSIMQLYADNHPSIREAIKAIVPDDNIAPGTLVDIAEVSIDIGEIDKCKSSLQEAYRGLDDIDLINRCIKLNSKRGDYDGLLFCTHRLWLLFSNNNLFDEILSGFIAWRKKYPADSSSAEYAADLLKSNPDFRSQALDIYLSLLKDPGTRCEGHKVRWILRKALAIDEKATEPLLGEIKLELAKTGGNLELPTDDLPLRGEMLVMIGGGNLGQMMTNIKSILQKKGATVKDFIYVQHSGKQVDEQGVAEAMKKASFCIIHLDVDHSVTNAVDPLLKPSGKPVVRLFGGQSMILRSIENHFGIEL